MPAGRGGGGRESRTGDPNSLPPPPAPGGRGGGGGSISPLPPGRGGGGRGGGGSSAWEIDPLTPNPSPPSTGERGTTNSCQGTMRLPCCSNSSWIMRTTSTPPWQWISTWVKIPI